MKHWWNDAKQQKILTKIQACQWILKIWTKKSANQKSKDFWQIFVISIKKSIGEGMDLKIYRKSIASSLWIFILCDFHLCTVYTVQTLHSPFVLASWVINFFLYSVSRVRNFLLHFYPDKKEAKLPAQICIRKITSLWLTKLLLR